MSSQYIPKEQLTAYERWEVAAFDEAERLAKAMRDAEAAPMPPATEDSTVAAAPSAEELEALRRNAIDEGREAGRREGFAEGFAEGRAEGLAEGQSEAAEQARRVGELAAGFDRAVQGAESVLADEVLQLALDVARQVLRAEVAHRPDVILPVVREAMAALVAPHGHPLLILNPDDAALVRPLLADQIAHTGWRIVEDPTLARGSCRVESGGTGIDATIPERWRRVVAALGQTAAWDDR